MASYKYQDEDMQDELLDDNFSNEPLAFDPTQDEKTLGLVSHIGTLAGGFVPFGNIILPLILWQMHKDKSPFVSAHAKESLNFQISMTIAYIISAILIFVFVGIFLLIGLAIFSLIVTIMATIKASNGEYYKYPINFNLVK